MAVQVAIFNKIEQSSLRHEVVDMIREAIISGKLEPGTHLAENALASQMSVSRAPIREALRQLEQEGLIVSIPNKGSFVKDFDEKDIDEVFTLRATLENLAMELALGEGLQESDFDHLAQLINSQKEAVENEDFDRLTTLDVQFHE
ncbi:MAG: GntR family transcriptional regulator, partial [Anaerolineae bacterium]